MIKSTVSAAATSCAPTFYEGPAFAQDDVRLQLRYFTYETAAGLVAGADFNVVFALDGPARKVWPYLKDWNLWMNSYGYFWSGVIGDMEGQIVRLSVRAHPHEAPQLHPNIYQVLKVIPEHLLVKQQPVPEDGSNGGISPGFHVFMLNAQGDKTLVTVLMEHASRTRGQSVDEALTVWRDLVSAKDMEKWRDFFIPDLRKLVVDGR